MNNEKRLQQYLNDKDYNSIIDAKEMLENIEVEDKKLYNKIKQAFYFTKREELNNRSARDYLSKFETNELYEDDDDFYDFYTRVSMLYANNDNINIRHEAILDALQDVAMLILEELQQDIEDDKLVKATKIILFYFLFVCVFQGYKFETLKNKEIDAYSQELTSDEIATLKKKLQDKARENIMSELEEYKYERACKMRRNKNYKFAQDKIVELEKKLQVLESLTLDELLDVHFAVDRLFKINNQLYAMQYKSETFLDKDYKIQKKYFKKNKALLDMNIVEDIYYVFHDKDEICERGHIKYFRGWANDYYHNSIKFDNINHSTTSVDDIVETIKKEQAKNTLNKLFE